MTAQEIIQASETIPVDKFAPAMEIVKVSGTINWCMSQREIFS